MTFIILLAIVAYALYKGRLFLSKAWLAFGDPLMQKMGRKAEELVVAEQNVKEAPLSKAQAEEVRK